MAVFLTAEWRKLAMANYVVEPKLLEPWLPAGTELDLWNNQCYVSLVGFMFLNTKVKGIKIPFHVNFEEINLRFYVKRKEGDAYKRGVVFIKEIVPKPAIAWVANTLYGENYEALTTAHIWSTTAQNELSVSYGWTKRNPHFFKLIAENKPQNLIAGSEAEFITEHYWGYAKYKENKTMEYQVLHPSWQIYAVKEYEIAVDFYEIYGEEFDFLNHQKPQSVFLAEGSEIVVMGGVKF